MKELRLWSAWTNNGKKSIMSITTLNPASEANIIALAQRKLAREGNEESAIDFIVRNIDGIDAELARDILLDPTSVEATRQAFDDMEFQDFVDTALA